MADESHSICSSKPSWWRAGVHSLLRAALFFFSSETNPNYRIKPGFSHLFTVLTDPLMPVRGKPHPTIPLLEEILPESSCRGLEHPEEIYILESLHGNVRMLSGLRTWWLGPEIQDPNTARGKGLRSPYSFWFWKKCGRGN